MTKTIESQHELDSNGSKLSQWEKHGTCGDFASAEHYFKKTQELFKVLVLPDENLKPPSVFNWLKEHNEKLKHVRIGYRSREIQICYDKDWNVIDCPTQ